MKPFDEGSTPLKTLEHKLRFVTLLILINVCLNGAIPSRKYFSLKCKNFHSFLDATRDLSSIQ